MRKIEEHAAGSLWRDALGGAALVIVLVVELIVVMGLYGGYHQ